MESFITLLRRPSALAVVLGLVIYGTFLALRIGACAGGSDSSGYLNNAKLLAHGQTQARQRQLPGPFGEEFSSYLFVPLGFVPRSPDLMVPTYPIGLPLGVAATAKLIGWDAAPNVFMLFSALAGLVLLALLVRETGVPWSWAWLGAIVLGASPLYIFLSLQLLSDMPATTAVTATLLCAWWSRRRPAWALAAGALTAIAVLIRPNNVLLIFPLLLGFGLNWRLWLWLALGGLPGAALQCLYNWRTYGNPLVSGYGSLGGMFSWDFVPPTLVVYAQWLPVALTPVGLAIIALPWTARHAPRLAGMLGGWVVVLLGFYVSYRHTHDAWWCLRFVLPAFPAAIAGGLWAIHAGWVRVQSRLGHGVTGRRFYGPGAALIAALLVHSAYWSYRLHVADIGRNELTYLKTARWVQANLPADAVIAGMQSTGALNYYSDLIIFRYDMLKPGQFAELARRCAAARRPIYAVLWPYELTQEHAFARLSPGRWSRIGKVDEATIWQYQPEPAAIVPAS